MNAAIAGAFFASNGQSEAAREVLALRIIGMARLGERDPRRLRDDALLHIAQRMGNSITRGGNSPAT